MINIHTTRCVMLLHSLINHFSLADSCIYLQLLCSSQEDDKEEAISLSHAWYHGTEGIKCCVTITDNNIRYTPVYSVVLYQEFYIVTYKNNTIIFMPV